MRTLVTGTAGSIGSTLVDHRSRQSQRRPPVANLAGLRRDGTASRSTGYDVLVLDAAFKQSLTAVRSLGRAGLRVAAGESVGKFNPDVPVPAFRSRYCQGTLILPDLVADTPGFIAALTEFVTEHSPRVILPNDDVTIGVLRPYRQHFADLGCIVALASDPALDVANDKDRTLAVAARLGIAMPATIRLSGTDDLSAAVAELGFPFVLKPTVSQPTGTRERLVPVDVINKEEATEVIKRFLDAGAGVLAQEWAPGRREGVTLFIKDDEVLAGCGHIAHRTCPPLGGASVIRESIKAPDDTLDAAVRLAREIGLQGVCEVEFRRDADNRPLLMEINARLAGTIENAVQAGVDLPLMIWRSVTGLDVAPVTTYRCGVRSRWLNGDFSWLVMNWRRVGRPDGVSHARAMGTFVSEFGKCMHYDYFDLHDLRPFLAELRTTAHSVGKQLSKVPSKITHPFRSKGVNRVQH
jgi:predicted ATP-grasp superfamily ATP-dependent carboligase